MRRYLYNLQAKTQDDVIQVINRAFDILEYIAKDSNGSKTLSEIAGELNLNAGTCANILKTLVHRNYVQKLDKQKGYRLGSRAEGFTGQESHVQKLMDAARDEVQKLTLKLNENALLGVLKDNKRRVLLDYNGKHELRATTTSEKGAYTTAVGRLLIAGLPDDETESYVQRYGLPTVDEWPEAVERKGLHKQLQKIRADGYSVRTSPEHIFGLAVPIHHGGRVVASVAVYLPKSRLNGRQEEFLNALKGSAKKVSKTLGG